ncbi:MAG: pyridoxamine kinase [Oscillospiraceae bacterium]|nr:pyridoxamine kinase [Oscillospiraceae bacterium]
MTLQKRVMAINDISGIGKSSLTVALPIISAAGVQCAVIPTAVLSTQTSGFLDFTFRDLSDDMLEIARHWKKEEIHIDAIYSGYLGSLAQINIVKSIIDLYRSEETLVLIDPVLGDDGELYSMFKQEHIVGMIELCSYGDIITPNLTEASLLLGKDFKEGVMSIAQVEEILWELNGLGSKSVILTGVSLNENDIGVACLDGETGESTYFMSDRIDGIYYGTGDVFASFLMGALMCDKSLFEATKIAVDHTHTAIKLTHSDNTNPRMGIRFESVLNDYWKALNN